MCFAGGNAYFGQKPTHELMVRWTQLNALMPALQFSIAPWDLSEETAQLCAEAVALRKKVRQRPKSPYLCWRPTIDARILRNCWAEQLAESPIACKYQCAGPTACAD